MNQKGCIKKGACIIEENREGRAEEELNFQSHYSIVRKRSL
jgi:hypothetical protein